MTEREKIERVVAAAVSKDGGNPTGAQMQVATRNWPEFVLDNPVTHKTMLDAALAEARRVGLAGRAESQNRTIDEFCGIGRANPPRKSKCPECGGTHFGDDKSDSCDMTRDRRGGWRQLGVYEG
jgi:hypothetical protein